jgi:hypothetical protein
MVYHDAVADNPSMDKELKKHFDMKNASHEDI